MPIKMILKKEYSDLDNVKLVMFERTMLPESVSSKVDGKTIFTKTGKEIEHTTYTFRDSFGDKLILLSLNSDYRAFEGECVDITISVTYNEFQKKNLVKLVSCSKSKVK